MNFVGSKGGAGVYQRIISWMPPHDVYVEPFAGQAAVYRHKRAAARSILVDLDAGVLDGLGGAVLSDGLGDGRTTTNGNGDGARAEVIVGDGIEFLRRNALPASAVVYCDPPYLRETRRNGDRDYYRFEWTTADHERFLDVVVGASSLVLVSGYWSELYADRLAGWRSDHFGTTTRAGKPAVEWLWANYPRPDRLHDYRFIGADYPQRWRIHKRQRSWLRMLEGMPSLERRAMLACVFDQFGPDVAEYLAGTGSTGEAVVANTAAGVVELHDLRSDATR